MTNATKDLILSIYDTVADSRRWPVVLEQIAHHTGAVGCIVLDIETDGADRVMTTPYFSAGYDTGSLNAYIHHFNGIELVEQDRFESFVRAHDRIDIVTDDVLEASEDALVAKPNVRQLMQFGIRHRAAIMLNKDNRNRSRFSIQHSTKHGPITAEERAALAEILPHVAKAMELGRPSTESNVIRRGLISAMDHLRIGICVIDRMGRVIARNREFDRQLDAFEELRIDPTGRLQLHESFDRAAFARLMEDALNHGRFGARPRKEAVVSERFGRAAGLCVEVAPLERAEAVGTTPVDGAVVFSMDASRPVRIDSALVRALFALTPAEGAIVDLVAEGLTNAEIAERRGRSPETVSGQVKSILGKTRAANRTQLVRLLSGFSGGLLAED